MGIRKQEAFGWWESMMADYFRVISHPCRIKIISLLLIHGSRTVGELSQEVPTLSQSSLSDHVRILRESSLIAGDQFGTSIRYRLIEDAWVMLNHVLSFFGNEENLKSLSQLDANNQTPGGES